jgi:hypothetical protein
MPPAIYQDGHTFNILDVDVYMWLKAMAPSVMKEY